MIGLFGRLAVYLALLSCGAGAVIGLAGLRVRGSAAMGGVARTTRLFAWLFAACMAAAVLLMEAGLLGHDFSISYVAEVGSRSTPLVITLVSLWSSLNGSILFWAFILAMLTAAFAWGTRGRNDGLPVASLGVLMTVGAFFAFLVAGVANPFQPISPVPVDGPGPNPLLQNHPLMVLHPPSLYVGYVGMAVPFAMSVASLLLGRLDAAWIARLRRWALFVWAFLTLGILLGGLWSYEVLGWGGYWAWDPVENASFIPWLTLTAFVHSAMVTERRGTFQGWTLSLLLASFLLSLLGTFMTRSGVFNSVHSFTQSDIGPVFLVFLAASFVACLLLLAIRLDRLAVPERIVAAGAKDASFLANNLVFVAFALTVLLGTVYPLLIDATTGEKISVGEPYFNKMALPMFAAILLLMGAGPALPWAGNWRAHLGRVFGVPVFVAVGGAALALALGLHNAWAVVVVGLAAFAATVSLQEMAAPIRIRMRTRTREEHEGLARAIITSVQQFRRRYIAHAVHLGVVVAALAIAVSSSFRQERSFTIKPGESAELAGYRLTLQGVDFLRESNRVGEVVTFQLSRGGNDLGTLVPRLNHYPTMKQPVGSPAVKHSLGGDFYVSVLAVDEAGHGSEASQVSIRAIHEPMVGWLWAAGFVLVAGGLGASLPPRATRRSQARASATSVPTSAPPSPKMSEAGPDGEA